jgi:hypothetical protein
MAQGRDKTMTDWLVTATETQAKLEDALTKLAAAEEELARHRYNLSIIAHDGYELSWEKIVNQRDYFIKLARQSLYPEQTK